MNMPESDLFVVRTTEHAFPIAGFPAKLAYEFENRRGPSKGQRHRIYSDEQGGFSFESGEKACSPYAWQELTRYLSKYERWQQDS